MTEATIAMTEFMARILQSKKESIPTPHAAKINGKPMERKGFKPLGRRRPATFEIKKR